MPTNHHCKYNKVWDYSTKKYRCCKNKHVLGCYRYCYLHYVKYYTKYAILIQKIYKGFFIRKKLDIYYKLPRELQRKIIWHMNSSLYLRHYNSSISKLIYNRYLAFYNNQLIPHDIYNRYNDTEKEKLYDNFIYECISLLKLSIKYYHIIDISKIPYFNIIKTFKIFKIFKLLPKDSIEYKLMNAYNKLFIP